MNTYCLAGHRVQYETVKPAKCPICSGLMEVKAAAVAAVQSAPPIRQPWPKRETFYKRDESVGAARATRPAYTDSEDFGDMEFDSASIRVSSDASRPMTVKELQESGTAVERREDTGTRVKGVERVSTADLVNQMIAQDGGRQQVAKAAARPKARRNGGGRKGKGSSA